MTGQNGRRREGGASDVGTWRKKVSVQRRALLGTDEHRSCQEVTFLAADEFRLLTRTFNG